MLRQHLSLVPLGRLKWHDPRRAPVSLPKLLLLKKNTIKWVKNTIKWVKTPQTTLRHACKSWDWKSTFVHLPHWTANSVWFSRVKPLMAVVSLKAKAKAKAKHKQEGQRSLKLRSSWLRAGCGPALPAHCQAQHLFPAYTEKEKGSDTVSPHSSSLSLPTVQDEQMYPEESSRKNAFYLPYRL